MVGAKEVPSAKDFLDHLLEEGKDVPCDVGSAGELELELPPWFDEKKVRRGQRFYNENNFAVGSSNLCGLIGVLAIPSILKVLMFTERSSTPVTAYKRYLATILHVVLWHDIKLTKNSSSWKSLLMIRKRHLMSSQSACKHSIGLVSQKDLALTQFAFIGLVLTRPQYLGLPYNNIEDLVAYAHLWRCFGYMLGIEERFNICRESFEDTVLICKDILEKVYRPSIAIVDDEDFNRMTKALTDGLTGLSATMNYDAVMFFTRRLVGIEGYEYLESDYYENRVPILDVDKREFDKPAITNRSQSYKKLDWYARFILFMSVMIHSYILKNTVGRMYYNFMHRVDLFIYKYFPYLGWYYFGLKNAFVDIRVDKYKEKGE